MKQGKLIRRAVSAALAGCMTFTLSAPALAESTDALMQLSMTRRSAVSVLDAENGDIVNYGITVTHGKKAIPVTSANCDNILGDSSDSTLSYDPAAKKLTSNGTIYGLLSINAPDVDVELNGENFALQDSGLNGILTIENANDVTVSSQKFAAVQSDVNVTCTGKLTVITNDSSWAAIGRNLTVHSAASVQIESEGDSAVGGDVIIECACPATFFKKNQNGRIAQSITYAGDYGYYTDDTADTAIDPNVMPIPVETAKYVRIAPKMRYDINTAKDATIKLQGQSTELKTAFAGEEVTVTAAGRKNAEFTGWTDLDSVLTSDQLTAKEVTFTMPDKNVTLTPNYKQYYTITSTDDVTIKVDNDRSTATAKALEGQHIVALANNKDGYVFENWEVDGVTLNTSNSVNYTNFEMPAKNVTLTPHYAKLHTIEVVNGTANITSAKKGTKVTVTADDRPGYVFDHWESEQIRLTTSEATNPSLTFAMPDEDVVLKAVPKTLYTITVEGGTVNNAVSARVKSGDPVTVVPEDKGADWKFIEWEVINAPENFSIDTSNPALQFNMPVGNVTLKAVQMRYRTITVNNGLGQTVKTDALRGETYTFTADKLEGQRFDYWEVTDPDGTRNLMDETINITVPKGNITLTAHYKTLYTITVDGKTIGTAAVGDTVHIKADLPEDRKFSRWEGNVSLNGHEEDSEFDLVITEGKNVELTSVTTQRYYIIIIDANGETKTEAEAGSTYSIKAAGRDGWDFTGWVVDNADVVRQLDLTKADNQAFVMPTGTDVTITATYKKQRTVTVIGGTVNGNDSVTALREETVEIKAEYDPYEKKFDHWEVKGPKGWDLEDDQKTNPEFTLTVPKGNVTLTAVYNDYHNITVEGGYATPDRAIAGTQITLTPDLPEDQEFDYWYSTDINLREDQRGNPNLTFKMRDFDIKITAVPKQLYFVDLEDADTTANGEDTRVEVKTGEEVVLVAPEREGFRFNHWEVTSGTVGLIDADKTTAYFTMKSENVKIKAIYDEYHTITMVDGKGTAYDADGKEITSAVVGDKITIVAKDRDSHEFNHWEIDPDNVILEDPNAERTYFTMPDEAVKVKAKYKHLQSITMNHGTAYDEDFSETDIAKAKQTITIKAEDRYADGLVFDHWAVDTDNVILADEHGEKTTFEMVNGPVELTAHYKARVTVFSVPAKFEEGIGEHSDETWEKVGETATITAKIDEETFPGMEFDYWEVIPTDLDIGNIHSQTISFEVPECEVKLVAHWKASGMNPIVDPDEDLDPGFGVETESSDGGAGGAGAAIAGVAIGGAAVWGGYEIATRVILHGLLPEGAAIPANRGQLALLIWTEKGKPEPAAQPAFADITDAEQAKAAQWCVEQGLLDAREGKFESDGWMPKFKTIEIWNKAFPKK